MGILTGIDLLGKSYLGDENNKCVRKRFTEYCKKYIDSKNTEVIFQFRNALLHTYGLYSKDWKGKTYHFSLIAYGEDLVTLLPNNFYRIDLYTLWEKFENSIDKYRKDLTNDNILQQNFQKIIKDSIIQIKQVKIKTK